MLCLASGLLRNANVRLLSNASKVETFQLDPMDPWTPRCFREQLLIRSSVSKTSTKEASNPKDSSLMIQNFKEEWRKDCLRSAVGNNLTIVVGVATPFLLPPIASSTIGLVMTLTGLKVASKYPSTPIYQDGKLEWKQPMQQHISMVAMHAGLGLLLAGDHSLLLFSAAMLTMNALHGSTLHRLISDENQPINTGFSIGIGMGLLIASQVLGSISWFFSGPELLTNLLHNPYVYDAMIGLTAMTILSNRRAWLRFKRGAPIDD